MPSVDHFRQELRVQIERATKRGASTIVINSGELHLAIGGYPGPNQRLQSCCDAMKAEMKAGDIIIGNLADCQAAALTIRYQLPHAEKSDGTKENDSSLQV